MNLYVEAVKRGMPEGLTEDDQVTWWHQRDLHHLAVIVRNHAEIDRLTAELDNIKSRVLFTPHGYEFMRESRRAAFQMQGCYDGAMSEECKKELAVDYALLDKLITEGHNRGGGTPCD